MSADSFARLVKDARRLLETPFWIPELKSEVLYERLHDDHDGTEEGKLQVSFLLNGDAVFSSDIMGPALRFRNLLGGGTSLRTRNALMLLAYAMKLDAEEGPPQ